MRTLSTTHFVIASVLDAVALLAAKCLPIAGAGVFYTRGLSWRVDAWKEGSSWTLQAGGYEAIVDLKD